MESLDQSRTLYRLVHDIGRFCGITSLKSVIGHTKAAAGVGAFIKAVMGVNRRVLPPTAACRYPHPAFRAEASALYPIVTGKITPPDNTLRAGISAMGFGGINCHVCLESADPPSSKLTRPIDGTGPVGIAPGNRAVCFQLINHRPI